MLITFLKNVAIIVIKIKSDYDVFTVDALRALESFIYS